MFTINNQNDYTINFINQILTNDYEKYDDDFLSYYVNFLKSLSLKIDNTTIQSIIKTNNQEKKNFFFFKFILI